MSDLNMPGEEDGIQGDEPPSDVEEEPDGQERSDQALGRTPPPPD